MKEVVESRKETYPRNVLTAEGLVTFPKSVLTQNKKIMMTMKNLAVIRNIKRVRACTIRNSRKNKKNFYSKEDSED